MTTSSTSISRLLPVVVLAAALTPVAASAETEMFSVLLSGRKVGFLKAETERGRTVVDYDVKNNGRGPTLRETIVTDSAGIPTEWTITGTTTFGSKVNERFRVSAGRAEWSDPTGKGSAAITAPAVYVPEQTSGWGSDCTRAFC